MSDGIIWLKWFFLVILSINEWPSLRQKNGKLQNPLKTPKVISYGLMIVRNGVLSDFGRHCVDFVYFCAPFSQNYTISRSAPLHSWQNIRKRPFWAILDSSCDISLLMSQKSAQKKTKINAVAPKVAQNTISDYHKAIRGDLESFWAILKFSIFLPQSALFIYGQNDQK